MIVCFLLFSIPLYPSSVCYRSLTPVLLREVLLTTACSTTKFFIGRVSLFEDNRERKSSAQISNRPLNLCIVHFSQPSASFYITVEQLVQAPVNSYPDIEAKEQEGTRNRTVAATNMNATSSRAHTIITINFTQKAPNAAGESMTKQSSINLVDLAGR